MPSPYDRVRVEDPSTGHQFTTCRVRAETVGLKILKGKSVDSDPLPRTDLAGHPAPRKKKSQPKADQSEAPHGNEKESLS